MNTLLLIFCVMPVINTITISPNGNSPEIKMIGGMMVEEGFVPMKLETTANGNNMKSRKLDANSTKLSINERYRRLIPYMTFYYANDNTPITEAYNKDVEVEKAEIVEQKTIEQSQRQPKKIMYAPQRTIPRYQGNRLTQFNIASSNPTKVHYKEVPYYYQTPHKFSTNFNPILSEHVSNVGFDHGRFVQKYNIVKSPSVPFTTTTRKPYLNLYGGDDDTGSVQYYVEKNEELKYKLVPYEQTPVKILPPSENVYVTKKPIPVPVLVHKEPVYVKPRPVRPHYTYDNIQRLVPRKPAVVSENFYEKHRPQLSSIQSVTKPIIESGFKPIANPAQSTENLHLIPTTVLPPSPVPQFEINEKPSEDAELDTVPAPQISYRPDYYQYVANKPTFEPEQYVTSKSTLSDLLNSLQLNKSIPKPITRENVGSSIRTLLQVLNALKAMQQNDVDTPILSTPKPFIVQEAAIAVTIKPEIEATPTPTVVDPELHEEPYLAHVNTPSQHLDDFPTHGSSSQRFPLPVQSDEEGGTPGRPGVDYPVLTTIPPTSFDCKTQRYKGFFADPETRCQVWHYCDLNGGQASFLCPNGTIFSQAGLTCDWWFNVRCASTTQLYVLNESLYKYILPHSPKFPEDYSGPLVDKYLTLKFKEMEEQFRKNKNKQNAKEKIDTDEDGSSEETTDTVIDKQDDEQDERSSVSEPSVLIESPGTSGNVQRLQD